jgi:hypothetical protein
VLKALRDNAWNLEAAEEALHVEGAEEEEEEGDGINLSQVFHSYLVPSTDLGAKRSQQFSI